MSILLYDLIELILHPEIKFHLLQKGLLPFLYCILLTLFLIRQLLLLLLHILLSLLILLKILIPIRLIIHLVLLSVGCYETALIPLIQNVVSEKHPKLVSPDPWALGHVVYVAGLFYNKNRYMQLVD